MRRTYSLLLALVSLVVVGVVLGQALPASAFELVQEIGERRPRGIIYDPNFDRFALVDPAGRLALVDAASFATQHILYENGLYNAYQFSPDGRWLVLAIETRLEVWDAQTGTLLTDLNPDGALRVEGPLYFSEDGGLLCFNTQVRAPQELRRSENDTTNLPWIWDVRAALRERSSVLPGRVSAQPFFDYRNGFVFGAHGKIIAGLPERLQLLELTSDTISVIGDIPAPARAEPDPVTVWFSLRDTQMYVLPNGENYLVQVNTEAGTLLDLPIGRDLRVGRFADLETIALSDQARIIGQPNSRESSALLRVLFGDDQYPRSFGYHPLTVTLVDILTPATPQAESWAMLVYIFDEQTGIGRLELIRPPDANQLALHPDGNLLLLRRYSGVGQIEVYNLDSGDLEMTYYPALPDFEGNQLLAYNATGAVVISDWQRFDAADGAVLFENLERNYGYEQFFFSQDSRRLTTLNGSQWTVWDVATGQVVQRETVAVRGSILRTSPDNQRFLTVLSGDDPRGSTGVEIYDLATQERRSVFFDELPDRSIIDIIPSPNWENYLVIYSVADFGPYAPGNEIAIYSMNAGRLWFLAGDDLPEPGARSYGWLDNERAYIYGERGGQQQPQRVYGLEFDANGLPACLVQAFPDEYPRWLDLWDRLVVTRSSTYLYRLTQRLCASLPASVEQVDALFNPTAVPTRPPVTATPSLIAGVPVCLTERFPGEAQQYAEDWRALTEGLPPEQVAELEALLCESLQGQESPPVNLNVAVSNAQVVVLDIRTGSRELGTYIPRRAGGSPYLFPPDIQPVLDEYFREFNSMPNGALSPDGTLFAIFTDTQHIRVYRLAIPYETIVANQQATQTAAVQGFATDAPQQVVRLQPTALPPFEPLGPPRPTLTPTVTPTSPPLAEQRVDLPEFGAVVEICPATTTFNISAPPPDYAPTGRLFVTHADSDVMWVLEPESGTLYLDETLPRCGISLSCNFSFDGNWILTDTGELAVSRPDGSARQVLFREEEREYGRSATWIGLHTLEYSYLTFDPQRSINEIELVQRYDPAASEQPAPQEPRFPRYDVNGLPTDVLAVQPGLSNRYALVSTSFNTGSGTGYRFYIYDSETGEALYFARFADPRGVEAFWHPLGTLLFYRFSGFEDWYVFDPALREHRLLGNLPNGQLSRDGRYWVSSFALPFDAAQARLDAGQPVPGLQIWDSATGLTRRYCFPGTAGFGSTPLYWSPDNRYLAFRLELPQEAGGEVSRRRTYILDTASGYVTELTFDISGIVIWTQDPQ